MLHPEDDITRTQVQLCDGTAVSHYRIIEKLGSGAVGEVYRAHDELLDRPVAIKFLSAWHCSDEDHRRRFLREARAAARLRHPNIVLTLDIGDYRDMPYIVFECLEPRTLRERMRESPLDLTEILRVSLGLVDGIGAAHRQGIVHRDIKPSNILLDSELNPKLVDFGLAVLTTLEADTRTTGIVGTVGYMSPEQARGVEIDERSDYFSLGVVIYEMITGVNPFRKDSEMLSLAALMEEEPQPLDRYRRDVPARLNDIVLALLQKDPAARYQCADHLRDDLATCQHGDALPSPLRTGPCVTENRLAVLPFDVFEPGTGASRLGEMFSHLVITGLSDIPNVDVVSGQRLYDLMTLEGRQPADTIDRALATRLARRAEARWMLLGNVLNQAPFVLTTQLIDVQSGLLFKGHRFDMEPAATIFSAADEVLKLLREDFSGRGKTHQHVSPVAQLTTSSPDALRHYLDGFTWQSRWDEPRAKEEYTKAIACDPDFAMAYYGLASIPVPNRLSLIQRAEALAERATFRERCYIKALRLRLTGDRPGSMAVLHELLDRHPDEKLAHFWIGVNLHYLNDFSEAIGYLRKAIELDPLFLPAYNQLIYTLNRAGQFEESMVIANQFIQLTPDDPNPYDSRGEVLGFNGRLEAALASYREALRRKPVLVASLQSAGILYVLKQDYAHAQELFDQLHQYVSANPWVDPFYYQVTIPLRQGKWRQALAYLDQGIAADSTDVQRRLHVGCKHQIKALILLEIGHPKEALDECLIAMEIGKQEDWWYFHGVNPYMLHCRILARNGLASAARQVVENEFSGAVEHDVARIMRYQLGHGLVELECGNIEEALTRLEKAENVKPRWLSSEHFLLQTELAKLYLRVGRHDRAVELLEESLRAYAVARAWNMLQDVKNHYFLAVAYAQSGWNVKAREQFELFLEIWKDADSDLGEIQDAKSALVTLVRGN